MAETGDIRAFRDALGAFATGVTIVTTCDAEGRDVGLTANSFNSVSLDPPMVLWSLAKTSSNLATFNRAEQFAVHILAVDQQPLSDRFAGKGADKFAGLELGRNAAGVPLLGGCTARFECRTAYRYEGGDHVIFVGEVTAFDHLDKPPLVFHGGRYAVARIKPKPAASQLEGELDDTSLGSLLTRTHMRLVAPLRLTAERLGLSTPTRYMLNVLMAGPAQDLTTINEIIGYTGVRVTLDDAQGLVKRGLATLENVPGDEPKFHLSDDGRRLTLELMAAAKAVEADALAGLDDDEQHILRDLLTRLVAGLTARGDERVTRHLDLVRGATATAGGAP